MIVQGYFANFDHKLFNRIVLSYQKNYIILVLKNRDLGGDPQA